MKSKMALGSLMVVVLLASGASPSSEGDLDRLQGRWETKVGLRRGTLVRLEIRGHAVAAKISTPQGVKIEADGEMRIDETAKPKAVDWVKFTTLDGEEIPDLRAIYRLEGDRLYVRSGGFNDERPREFHPGEGVWAGVLVFRRAEAN